MARPTPATGRVRLHILDDDATTSRGHVAAEAASGTHSKSPDGSALTFTANHLEDDLAASATMLDEAFAVPQRLVSGSWVDFGTPYALAPGSFSVISQAEASAKEQSPVCVGALQALASECIVLPNECDDDSPTMRHACGGEEMGGLRYIGWQSKGYTDTGTFHDADVYTPASGSAKEDEPSNWDENAASADFVYRNADEGGLTLLRFPTFTLAARTTVKFIIAADEEAKLYLDGPNQGGVIIDSTAVETGYTDKVARRLRLEPGTYRPAGEFTSVDSAGGDGNDSMRFACGTIDSDGKIDTLLSSSGSTTRVYRQAKSDERPGMTGQEVIRRLLQDNSDQGVTGADILLDNKDFTDSLDSSGAAAAAGKEWVWPLGTSLATVLVDMSEALDFDLTTAFVFRCWNDRGSDLSSSVGLIPGGSTPAATMNILDYSGDSDPAGPTRYLTASQDGYDIVVGTSAELSTRPRFGFSEQGAAASIARAKTNARQAIAQTGNGPRRYYRARIMAVTGAVPETDFTVRDLISGRDHTNTAAVLEVTDVGFEQDECSAEYLIGMTGAI